MTGVTGKSVRAIDNVRRICEGAPGRPVPSWRWSTSTRTCRSRAADLYDRRADAESSGCHSPSAGSSATCRTRRACSWGSTCVRRASHATRVMATLHKTRCLAQSAGRSGALTSTPLWRRRPKTRWNAIREATSRRSSSPPDGEQLLRAPQRRPALSPDGRADAGRRAERFSADGTILYCNDRFAQLMARRRGASPAINLDAADAADAADVGLMGGGDLPGRLSACATAAGNVNPAQVSFHRAEDRRRPHGGRGRQLTSRTSARAGALRESNRLKDEFLGDAFPRAADAAERHSRVDAACCSADSPV